ncbi:MAG: pyridoxamine 5'-phosphate oxidase family protein [Clostridia bacterium]|nr:pyridoxamine 5'-phosphate oxidase family protein [Clostridia bacterium]
MRKELTINEIEEIKNNEWIIFSTVNDDKEPHAIIVIPSRVEKDRIILSNIQMSKSIKNILNNTKCFIDVYIKEKNDKQIKINGIGKVSDSGELFEEIKDYEETNNLPDDLKVKSIIVIEITNVEVTEG